MKVTIENNRGFVIAEHEFNDLDLCVYMYAGVLKPIYKDASLFEEEWMYPGSDFIIDLKDAFLDQLEHLKAEQEKAE